MYTDCEILRTYRSPGRRPAPPWLAALPVARLAAVLALQPAAPALPPAAPRRRAPAPPRTTAALLPPPAAPRRQAPAAPRTIAALLLRLVMPRRRAPAPLCLLAQQRRGAAVLRRSRGRQSPKQLPSVKVYPPMNRGGVMRRTTTTGQVPVLSRFPLTV